MDNMNFALGKTGCRVAVLVLGMGLFSGPVPAQTEGSVELEVTVLDYVGKSSTKHWTVAWITTQAGEFIKTLWRQGPSLGSSHWNNHCRAWYSVRVNDSSYMDGYTSATAPNYSPPNSPVVLTWDCQNAAGELVPDGNYKFWVQYAEDSGQGPYTTSGLLWTKGVASSTNTYPNQGSNFSNMRVVWTSVAPPATPPVFATTMKSGGAMEITAAGPTNQIFYLVGTSDLELPLEEWPYLSTNQFDEYGTFTNLIISGTTQQFYRILLP